MSAIHADAAAIRNRGGLPMRESAEAIVEVTTHMKQIVRGMLKRLRPPGLEGLGPSPALRELVGAYQPRHPNVIYRLKNEIDLTQLDSEGGIAVYRGYVTKNSAPEVLASGVAEVMAGKLALSPDIAKAIAILRLLSAREFEIFRLLVGGSPAVEIAKPLSLSGKTIANYHTLIKQKLRVTSDVETVLLAQRQNII